MTQAYNAFAAILAGGSGTRMGNPDKPKQFLALGDKPILAHTIEKFAVSGLFDEVVVLCPEAWMQQTIDLVNRYCSNFGCPVVVVAGGSTRNDTIACAISYIQESHEVDQETILVTHDAVRPFVSHRIIADNVAAVRAHGACDTVVPATDTIVESADGTLISSIPNRNVLYQGQTPQSFNLLQLAQLMESLTEEEKHTLTDACKIFVLRDKVVALVKGDPVNMKVTYPQDMRLARALLDDSVQEANGEEG